MPPPAEAPPVHSPSDTDELSEASERSGAAAESSRRVGEIVRSTLPAPDAAWVLLQAKQTHREAVRRSRAYHDWLGRNPGFGTAP